MSLAKMTSWVYVHLQLVIHFIHYIQFTSFTYYIALGPYITFTIYIAYLGFENRDVTLHFLPWKEKGFNEEQG
jgi:hypothetical protein